MYHTCAYECEKNGYTASRPWSIWQAEVAFCKHLRKLISVRIIGNTHYSFSHTGIRNFKHTRTAGGNLHDTKNYGENMYCYYYHYCCCCCCYYYYHHYYHYHHYHYHHYKYMYVYVCFIDCAQTQNHTYTNMISNTT